MIDEPACAYLPGQYVCMLRAGCCPGMNGCTPSGDIPLKANKRVSGSGFPNIYFR